MSRQAARSGVFGEKGLDLLFHSVLVEPLVLTLSVALVAVIVGEIPHFSNAPHWLSYLLFSVGGAISITYVAEDSASGLCESLCIGVNLLGRLVLCACTAGIFYYGGFRFEGHSIILSLVPLLAMALHLLGCMVCLWIAAFAFADMISVLRSNKP